MAVLNEENFAQLIANRDDQRKIIKSRCKPYIERKVRKKEFAGPDDGWYVLDDTLKTEFKLAKDKPHDEVFLSERLASVPRGKAKKNGASTQKWLMISPKLSRFKQVSPLANEPAFASGPSEKRFCLL